MQNLKILSAKIWAQIWAKIWAKIFSQIWDKNYLGKILGEISLDLGDFFSKTSGHPESRTICETGKVIKKIFNRHNKLQFGKSPTENYHPQTPKFATNTDINETNEAKLFVKKLEAKK